MLPWDAVRGRADPDGAVGALENREEAVAFGLFLVAAGSSQGRPDEFAMAGEDRVPAVAAEFLGELRRALDICEDECDRSIGEIRGQSLLQWDLGTDTCSCAWWTFDH